MCNQAASGCINLSYNFLKSLTLRRFTGVIQIYIPLPLPTSSRPHLLCLDSTDQMTKLSNSKHLSFKKRREKKKKEQKKKQNTKTHV